MSSPTDQQLVSRCLDGNQQAFSILIERYQKPIYNLARKTLTDERDAEDVTQNVFMKAYQNLATYNPDFKFFSWIYRIGINETINLAKRRKPFDPIDEAVSPIAAHVSDTDTEKEVLDSLMFLSPEDRALVLLKHFEGFSYDDISFIMDTPTKTVKSRLYTARQRLKEILMRERRILND